MRTIKFEAYIKELNIILPGVTPYPDGTIGIGHKQLTEALNEKFEIYDDCISDKEGNHIVSIMSGDDWYWFEQNDFELRQFIGLQSKEKKDIYKGDIVKYNDDPKVMVVNWNEKFASFCLDRKGWVFSHFFGEAAEADQLTITGNIYQNPELLKINE